MKIPGKSSQFRVMTDASLRAKITQAPAKLASTAAQDKKLLNFFERRVKTVINPAETSGASSTYQGNSARSMSI